MTAVTSKRLLVSAELLGNTGSAAAQDPRVVLLLMIEILVKKSTNK